MEALLIILLCLLAVLIAGVVLCVWLVFATIKGVIGLFRPSRPQPVYAQNPAVQTCDNAHCHCDNPAYARFCRRCGKSLPSLLRLVDHRVAG